MSKFFHNKDKKALNQKPDVKYPGIRAAMDGNSAVIRCERESSDAAGAFPITPSTQMGEYWAEAAASGHINISGRPLIFIEPEGEHAAAAVTAGLSMSGLRSANFSSGQGIAYMHESLYAAVGKRLTYVLNMGTRAITKATLNVHAGHDDYHCVDDTGFFQLFGKNAQAAADLNIIAHRIAELALNPGIVAQDGFLTTHLIESLLIPERELIAEYLGKPDDIINTPTAAQRIIYGETRRRIPELWDVDNPVMAGVVQNQDAYMQSVAAQRPFFFDHIRAIADESFEKFYQLTGRHYLPVQQYLTDDAEYLLLGQGSVVANAEVVADYLRKSRGIKIGVVDLVMFRPFPSDLISIVLQGRKAVTVLERVDQPLAVDLPLMREIRATVSKSVENGLEITQTPYPTLASYKNQDIPRLYSACFGLGSRDLQPEALIAAVENMLADGKHKKQYYLGIDFIHDKAFTPKQEIYQQTLSDAYPALKDLALHGSENPNLMPENSITVRFHSVGGWGAITTGKNLAMALFELLGYHIKANPKYGSEKKGQPTTYYLSASPEPIRLNCEFHYVDVVLSPDPNVFNHSNALAGLKHGGVFILQSDADNAEKVWQHIPVHYQKIIIDNEIQIFYLDAFRIAREEATDPELQLRMQGNAFQGAFFAATTIMLDCGFDEARLIEAVREQLTHKFGGKGARVVEDNLNVVKRGYDELKEVTNKTLTPESLNTIPVVQEPALPVMLKRLPQAINPEIDVHRFWEQTGNFYARGLANQNLTDPFIATGTIPAISTAFRDMTGIRFNHPQWIAENCTACGNCYTVCPDTAIPGQVYEFSQIFDTVVTRLKKQQEIKHLPRVLRQLETAFRHACLQADEHNPVRAILDDCIENRINENTTNDAEVRNELKLFQAHLGTFDFALTRPYFTLPEKNSAGNGGLFNISINPYSCKGCMECIAVCNDDALRSRTQTADSIEELHNNWSLWLDMPNTPQKYIRIDDLDQGIGALETLLLDKENCLSFASGDGACMGCSEKTVIHLFVATVEALMRPRVKKQINYLTDLINRLERHIQLKLVEEINIDDIDTMGTVINEMGDQDISLSDIAEKVEAIRGTSPIDHDWLKRITQLVAKLKKLLWAYTQGPSGKGRVSMGIINATGCTSVWGSTYPYNPYPFPWANHLFQDSPSMAMGVFEGHMAKMAEGFKAIRIAEKELSAPEDVSNYEIGLSHFNWQQFSDEEWLLCPPVVAVGGDGAMYDIGFQNLSRAMMSGKPLKIVVLDTQAYSNTGGQACTSGFFSQVSDMAPFGKVQTGKQEIRKEIGLIAMAHRTTYVMQSTIAHPAHMIESFIEGLNSKRPAMFNCYSACQPEHGIADDMGHEQARLAVESRAYPLFRYNPDKGVKPEDCFDLDGNPSIDKDWPEYQIDYLENGIKKHKSVKMTFADFAMTEGRFRKHFRTAPPDTWHENMVLLSDFLELPEAQREDKYPYIWTINRKQHLSRLLVDQSMVLSCEDRRNFWQMLKAIALPAKSSLNEQDIKNQVQQEVTTKLASSLMHLLDDHPSELSSLVSNHIETIQAPNKIISEQNKSYIAPWIDSEECTACDECIKINPDIFAYNENKKTIIKNPDAGPYRDLVRAAEKCTAQVIHPGLPRDLNEKEIDKWIKRGEKYN